MSYYGIKNLKVVKTDNGYNVSCMAYDSSLSDYNGKRIWEKVDKVYKEDYKTKEELEYTLFKDFLDGNFHTSSGCGKYQCLSWNNLQLIPNEKELEELKELENNYYRNRTIDRDTYYNRRYEIYFKLWKEYLEDKKKFKDNKFIIKLDAQGYTDIYVKGLGSSKCRYTYYSDEAKIFKGNPTHVLNKLSIFKNQSNIRVVAV